MQQPATLMIVIDEPLYLEGLKHLLMRYAPCIRCIAVRTTTQATAQLQGGGNVDLLMADHSLAGDVDSLAWLQQVGRNRPAIRRVLLAASHDPALSVETRRVGLAGLFSKTMEPESWLQALHIVLGGACYFAPPSGTSPGEAGAATGRSPASGDSLPTLNERQVSVLQLASAGLGNRQIAQHLHVTERTVKYHLSESFLRLASSSRTEAVAKAAAMGLIRLQGQQVRGKEHPHSSRS